MTTDLIPAANGQIVIKYGIHIRDSRHLLSSHLKQVILKSYKFLYRGCYRLQEELDYLNECVGLLSKEHDGTLLVRKDKIQESIYEFFELMEEIRNYADNAGISGQFRSTHKERKLSKSLRKFIAKMNGQTNIRLNDAETEVLQAINLKGEVKVFYINLRRISSAFHPIFQGQYASTVSAPEDLTDQQIRVKLLTQLSPELVAAYEETGSLLTEAGSLANTAEDEYFIGEVTNDYYFHLFENLQKVAKETVDFIQKEAVIVESLKQFKIIQLGLNKIIENSIANNMNAMKSQTDFLRSKVMGTQALSLTPSELEQTVDTDAEQAKKLREELYKTHVAPRIEQNRLEYEAKLAEMQAEYEADKKYLAVKNWEYKDQIKKLEAELAEKNSSQTSYPTPPSVIQKRVPSEPAATIEVAPAIKADKMNKDYPLTTDRIYRL